jgi:hypothetical protein
MHFRQLFSQLIEFSINFFQKYKNQTDQLHYLIDFWNNLISNQYSFIVLEFIKQGGNTLLKEILRNFKVNFRGLSLIKICFEIPLGLDLLIYDEQLMQIIF